LFSSIPIILRQWLIHDVRSGFLELNWHLVNVEASFVPCFGEVITVIDETVSAKDLDVLARDKVLWSVVLFLPQRHAWAVSENGLFG
jgi:hypothetical protein